MHGYNAYNYSVQPEVYTSASYGLPSLHNVTVVTQQPGSSLTQGQPQNIRDWSSGLCGCCEDCCSCEYLKVDCTWSQSSHRECLCSVPGWGLSGSIDTLSGGATCARDKPVSGPPAPRRTQFLIYFQTLTKHMHSIAYSSVHLNSIARILIIIQNVYSDHPRVIPTEIVLRNLRGRDRSWTTAARSRSTISGLESISIYIISSSSAIHMHSICNPYEFICDSSAIHLETFCNLFANHLQCCQCIWNPFAIYLQTLCNPYSTCNPSVIHLQYSYAIYLQSIRIPYAIHPYTLALNHTPKWTHPSLIQTHASIVGMYAFFFHPCFMCTLASRLDEFFCGSFCCGTIFDISMRTKLRTQYGIQVRTGWYAWVSYWLYLFISRMNESLIDSHVSHGSIIIVFMSCIMHKSVIYRLVLFYSYSYWLLYNFSHEAFIDCFFILSRSKYWYWLFLFLAWDSSEFVLLPGINPGRLLHDHVL